MTSLLEPLRSRLSAVSPPSPSWSVLPCSQASHGSHVHRSCGLASSCLVSPALPNLFHPGLPMSSPPSHLLFPENSQASQKNPNACYQEQREFWEAAPTGEAGMQTELGWADGLHDARQYSEMLGRKRVAGKQWFPMAHSSCLWQAGLSECRHEHGGSLDLGLVAADMASALPAGSGSSWDRPDWRESQG